MPNFSVTTNVKNFTAKHGKMLQNAKQKHKFLLPNAFQKCQIRLIWYFEHQLTTLQYTLPCDQRSIFLDPTRPTNFRMDTTGPKPTQVADLGHYFGI